MTESPDTHLTPILFEHDIQRLTDDFTGRDWIFGKIDEWLKNKSDRFFILTGEPGVGKSAIAAQLTKIRNDRIKAYHFCRAGDVETVRPGRILRSLAAQLGEKLPDYGKALANTIKPVHLRVEVNVQIKSMTGSKLTGVYIENLKESDPDNELDILIRAPLAELEKIYAQQQQEPPKAAVILIDSLDEAVTTTGNENIVTLLAKLSESDLPVWVRFILTSRPEDRVMRELKSLKPYKLEKMSEDNLKDIRNYIDKRVEDTKFQKVLQKNEVKDEMLSHKIVELSMGIFLYTELLLNDIEAERQPLDNLSALPTSIDEIYHKFLKRFKVDEWQKQYQPILGLLTVTQEPLTEKQLENFTGIDAEQLRYDLGVVRQFLDVDKDEEKNETYAIFHQSLRDYLLDKERNKHFWSDAIKQNNLFVNYYKKDSPTWEEVDWKKADRYGLLNLPKHLDAAGRKEEIYMLLTSSRDWMQTKFEFFSSDAVYVDDLELAINKFTDPLKPDELLTLVKLYAARQVVHQRASRYQDIDLKTLVFLGRYAEAFGYACQRTNAHEKLASLLIVHNALPQKNQYDLKVLDEAKKVAELIEEGGTKIQDLPDLAIALTQAERLSEAQEIISRINDVTVKAETLGKLAVAFAKKKDNEQAIAIFNQIKILIHTINDNDQSLKVEALRELAVAYLQTEWASEAKPIFKEAIAIALTIKDIKILRQLAVALAQAGDIENANILFTEAKKLIEGIKNNFEKAEPLRELALDFALSKFVEEAEATFNKAEEVARNIAQELKQVYPVLELAKALALAGDGNKASAIFDEAIKVPNALEEGLQQVEELRMFAEALVKGRLTKEASKVFGEARKAARNITGNWERVEALRNLAAGLVQTGLTEEVREVFSEAEELAPNKGSDAQQEQVLCKWAVVLAQAGFTNKASAICTDTDKFAQAKQEIDATRKLAEDVKLVKDLTQSESQTEKRRELVEAIDQARDSTKVREIADTAIKSNSCQEEKTLGALAVSLTTGGDFTVARRVAYTIEDDYERTSILNQLADILAWISSFKEAFSILELKNGSSQFLDVLVEWILPSEKIEQQLWVEILQETTRIFGWMYPYWAKIHDDLILESNRGEFLHVSPIIISPEQAQRLETYIQEATAILYHNIPKTELTTLESIQKIILEQILQLVSTKITLFHQNFEQAFNGSSEK